MSDAPRIAPELADLPHVPVTALEPLQGNLKELTKREYAKLKKSITDYGLIVPFFVWQEAGKLLDGHQRQRVMQQEGWELDVPVVYISAADEQDAKRKLLVVSSQYGRVTQEGWDEFTWDIDDDWLTETVHFDALPFVFGDWEPDPEPPTGADAEPQVNRAEELREEWGTQPGQLWRLPSRVEGQEHRLICGDCTDAAVVERLMGGERVDCTVTDPPYGVGVDYGSFEDTADNVRDLIKRVMQIINDHLPAAFTPGVPAMWDYPRPAWVGTWLHPAPVGGCPWGFVGNNPILFYGADPYLKLGMGRRPDSVVMASDRQGEEGHPTPKPLKVWEWLVERLTPKKGMKIFDPFVGSGTTIIACENLSRQCRAVEISPAYVAVALQRYLDAFGIRPVLIQ